MYDEFMQTALRHLLESGSRKTDGTGRRRRVKPLWWSRECEDEIRERRSSCKAYYRDQSVERKAEFIYLHKLTNRRPSSGHQICYVRR